MLRSSELLLGKTMNETFLLSKSKIQVPQPRVLLHFDEGNLWDNAIQNSPFVRNTAYGMTYPGAASSTSKFGAQSLTAVSGSLNGGIDFIDSTLDFTKEFTVEMWCRIVSPGNSAWSCLFEFDYLTAAMTQQWSSFFQISNTYALWWQHPSGFNIANDGSLLTVAQNTWHHFAFTLKDSIEKVWWNGALSKTVTNRSTKSLAPGNYFRNRLRVGNNYNGASNNGLLNTFVDEVLLYDKCLYDAPFTPPAAPYTYS